MFSVPDPKGVELSPFERFLPLWDFIASSVMGIILTLVCSYFMVSGFESLHKRQVDKYFTSLLNVMTLTLSDEERKFITDESKEGMESLKSRTALIRELDRRVVSIALSKPSGAIVRPVFEVSDLAPVEAHGSHVASLEDISLHSFRIRDSLTQYPYQTARGVFYAVSVPVFDAKGMQAIGVFTLKVREVDYARTLNKVRKKFFITVGVGVALTLIFAGGNYLARVYFLAMLRQRASTVGLVDGEVKNKISGDEQESDKPSWEELRSRFKDKS